MLHVKRRKVYDSNDEYDVVYAIDPKALSDVYADLALNTLVDEVLTSGVTLVETDASTRRGRGQPGGKPGRPRGQPGGKPGRPRNAPGGKPGRPRNAPKAAAVDRLKQQRSDAKSRYVEAGIAVQKLSVEIQSLRADPVAAGRCDAERCAQIAAANDAMREFRALGAAARAAGAAARAANRRRAEAAGRAK